MKIKPYFFMLLASIYTFGQGQSDSEINNSLSINNLPTFQSKTIDNNGYIFEITDAGANSEYSEYVSGFFKHKLISVSSKKLGVIAKIDDNTDEAYKDIFCLDYDNDGYLSSPLLFSRILNTANSEDQLSFSPDQHTVYYTRSNKENSTQFKLYKADLERDSHGNWINEELLDVNEENVSIEHPYVSPKGDKLYFSSNMSNSFGGYDLYVSDINKDGTLSAPKNLGKLVNTEEDDKYPSLDNDGKYLYFSSKGHDNIGGFDLFSSKIVNDEYRAPRNLGNTINTTYDEVAFYINKKDISYMSSNRPDGKGGFDIYLANFEIINQNLKGKILDSQTKSTVTDALVILKDEEGNEISRQTTKEDGTYDFDTIPFEAYSVTIQKDGFNDGVFEFSEDRGTEVLYYRDLEIENKEPLILDEDKLSIDNIYFDFNKHRIKEESFTTLNDLIETLKERPNLKLVINAHTDNKGTKSYNLRLSKRRAKSTLKYLTKSGIPKDQLQTKGHGEETPHIDCKKECTEEELQANRRVEFVILTALSEENQVNSTYPTPIPAASTTIGEYHIVAGAFSKKKNSIRKIEDLKSEGFENAKSIGVNKKGLYEVVYASYSDKTEATIALKNIKQTNNEEAWLKVKKID